MPKSSIASSTPSSFSWFSRSIASSMSCMTMLSVISRISVGAAEPGLGQDVADLVHDLGARELARGQVDRHVERRVHRELALQLAPRSAHASRSTQRPIGTISPVSSASGMNSSGCTIPRSGWIHRIRASTPVIRPDLELDHGLVVQDELLVLERALQVGLQLQAPQRGVVHRGLEDLVATLALLLRHVHRDVGVAHERLRDLFAAVTGFLRRRRSRRSRGRRPLCPRAGTAPRASA